MQRGREDWGEDLMYCILTTMTLGVLHIGLINTSTHSHNQYGTKHTHGPTHTQHHVQVYNIHITPPSNSRRINSLEFGQQKQMLIACLGLGKEVSNLDLSGKVVEGDDLVTYRAPSKVRVDSNVLGQLMLD